MPVLEQAALPQPIAQSGEQVVAESTTTEDSDLDRRMGGHGGGD